MGGNISKGYDNTHNTAIHIKYKQEPEDKLQKVTHQSSATGHLGLNNLETATCKKKLPVSSAQCSPLVSSIQIVTINKYILKTVFSLHYI